MAKEHVVEPRVIKNNTPNKAREVENPIFRELNENNISMEDFHKPLIAKIENQPTSSWNDEDQLGGKHVLRPNMNRNDVSYIARGSKNPFFES